MVFKDDEVSGAGAPFDEEPAMIDGAPEDAEGDDEEEIVSVGGDEETPHAEAASKTAESEDGDGGSGDGDEDAADDDEEAPGDDLDLPDSVGQLNELVEKCDVFAAWIDKATNQSDFSKAIVQKVVADYLEKFKAVITDMQPHVQEIEALIAEEKDAPVKVTEELKAKEMEREELKLRSLIGELAEGEFKEIDQVLDVEITELQSQIDTMTARREALEAALEGARGAVELLEKSGGSMPENGDRQEDEYAGNEVQIVADAAPEEAAEEPAREAAADDDEPVVTAQPAGGDISAADMDMAQNIIDAGLVGDGGDEVIAVTGDEIIAGAEDDEVVAAAEDDVMVSADDDMVVAAAEGDIDEGEESDYASIGAESAPETIQAPDYAGPADDAPPVHSTAEWQDSLSGDVAAMARDGKAWMSMQPKQGPPVDYPMTGDTLSIGRGRNNDIQIKNDGKVSRYHCRVICKNAEYIIEDNKSSNGTIVNGRAIARKKLEGGEQIVIGETSLTFHIE